MGFLIDSDVLIAAEREQFSLPRLMADLSKEPLALAAITASELLHGVHRAQDASMRERRSRFVEFLLDLFPVVPFDLEVARAHAALWASLSARGQPIGAHDLLVAATALNLQFGVITGNDQEFGRVPGIKVLNPF